MPSDFAHVSPERFDPENIPWRTIGKIAAAVTVLLLAVYISWKGVYTVEAHEEAVLLRFGKYHATAGPGLHFMIPMVDEAILVDTSEHTMRLPFGIEEKGSDLRLDDRVTQDESLILTGDLYGAIVEWHVVWRVQNPKSYVFSFNDSKQLEGALVAVARSVMHRVVGDYSADEVLTGKREEIARLALEEMRQRVESYMSGVDIDSIQMQRVTPPERVKPAFEEVNASIQERDKLVNEANQEANKLIPAALAEKDKLIQEAKGYADRRRAEAQGEISALLAKYEAYREAPKITRQRLYLEAIEEVLANSGTKTILDSDLKSLLPMLQLNAAEGSSN